MMARDMQQEPFSHGKLIPRDEYISLYEQIYFLLVRNGASKDVYGSKLYDKYKSLVQRNIQRMFYAQADLRDKQGSNVGSTGKIVLVGKGEEGLETFLEKFKALKRRMSVVLHLFAYLERYHIPRMGWPTLEEVLRSELNEQVLKKVTPQLKTELANLMDKRRDGKSVNEDLFGEGVALFTEMSPKETRRDAFSNLPPELTRNLEGQDKDLGSFNDLESFLLRRTRAYYAKTSPQWPQNTLEKKAEQALCYEREFAKMFLPKKSVSKFEEGLTDILEEIVITFASQNSVKMQDNELGDSLESSKKASLACSTHHKMQDSSKSSIVDAFRTANV
ncbi:hypothetical protein L7F22_055874 [Adiantum nelumboides]|nr:hypothetical protein [Adiantum nelumboides]